MVHLTYPPGGGDRLYLVLQPGLIVSFENRQDVEALAVFLNITERVNDQGNEEGLLGLAFDPDYESNGYFYVYYSASGPRRSVISRFSAEPGRGDESSEKQVMVIPQPYSNHNGVTWSSDRTGTSTSASATAAARTTRRGMDRTGRPC